MKDTELIVELRKRAKAELGEWLRTEDEVQVEE